MFWIWIVLAFLVGIVAAIGGVIAYMAYLDKSTPGWDAYYGRD